MKELVDRKIEDYPDVIEPIHIREIMRIGEKQVYELLNQEPPPFHFKRNGKRIKIAKAAFVRWLNGEQ